MTLRIAIACSGLGHVQRGVEAWAADLFAALRQAGAAATLFAAGAVPGAEVLPCLRRGAPGAIAVAAALRHLGGWRYGLGAPYEVEQTSFALALWRRVRRDYDILHVQDPLLALRLEQAHRRGLSRPRVIYANGTGERAALLRRFASVQLLTPAAFADWQGHRVPGQAGFMIPNFIDTARFTPAATPADQATARAELGLPAGVPIVLCCAAIRRRHKRIDYLLEEFANSGTDAMLIVVGAREDDTEALIAHGARLLGPRVRFLVGLPRSSMPVLYRAADLFVLTSLSEMFGIVLIEAMASGLPVLCHDTAEFRAIAGPAAQYADLAQPGGLAAALAALLPGAARTALAATARAHVARHFAAEVVVRDILAMYQTVAAA